MHAEAPNRALQIVELGAIVGRRLDLGERDLAYRSERGIAQQLVDVVWGVPHAKPGGQTLAHRRRRLVAFFVLFAFVRPGLQLFVSRLFSS